MRFLLDTNAVSALLAGHPRVRAKYSQYFGTIGVSAITLFEQHYGVAKSRKAVANMQALRRFSEGGVQIVEFGAEDAAVAGPLRRAMESKGRAMMGPFDLLIAAQALRTGATLVTSDSGFAAVEGLRVEDWAG